MMQILDSNLVHLPSDQPLYRRVAEALREYVQAGRLKAGDALPTQEQIARSARVNIGTVRRAVQLLVRDGTIVKEAPGVRARVAEESLKTDSASTVAADGNRLQSLQVVVEEVTATGLLSAVQMRVLDGQRLTLSTTVAAASWLGLQTGKTITVHIQPAAMAITSS